MKVWIEQGCIGCGLCEEICPEVFQVDETASVNEENIHENEDAIAEAAAECPVEVIIVSEQDYDLIETDDDDRILDDDEI